MSLSLSYIFQYTISLVPWCIISPLYSSIYNLSHIPWCVIFLLVFIYSSFLLIINISRLCSISLLGKESEEKFNYLIIKRKWKVFFWLSYLRCLKLQHSLDALLIEKKNDCDNITRTLMDLEKNTKDNINSRFDLIYMSIHSKLHATTMEKRKFTFSYVCYPILSQRKTCIFVNF